MKDHSQYGSARNTQREKGKFVDHTERALLRLNRVLIDDLVARGLTARAFTLECERSIFHDDGTLTDDCFGALTFDAVTMLIQHFRLQFGHQRPTVAKQRPLHRQLKYRAFDCQ